MPRAHSHLLPTHRRCGRRGSGDGGRTTGFSSRIREWPIRLFAIIFIIVRLVEHILLYYTDSWSFILRPWRSIIMHTCAALTLDTTGCILVLMTARISGRIVLRRRTRTATCMRTTQLSRRSMRSTTAAEATGTSRSPDTSVCQPFRPR